MALVRTEPRPTGKRAPVGWWRLATVLVWVAVVASAVGVAAGVLPHLVGQTDPWRHAPNGSIFAFRDTVWDPARYLLHGGNPYDPARYVAHLPWAEEFDLYAPAWFGFALPFALLPYQVGALVYVAAGAALATAGSVLIARCAGWRRPALTGGLLACWLLAWYPGRSAWTDNVSTLVVLAGVVLALRYRRDGRWLAAVGLALALVKPQFGLPLAACLLLLGGWRAVLRGIGIVVAASLPVLVTLVVDSGGIGGLISAFHRDLGAPVGRGAADYILAPIQQRVDVVGVLARVWHVAPGGAVQVLAGVMLLSAGALAARRWQARGAAPWIVDATVVLVVLECVLHQIYDLPLLLWPAAGAVRAWRRGRMPGRLLAVAVLFVALHVHAVERRIGVPPGASNLIDDAVLAGGYLLAVVGAWLPAPRLRLRRWAARAGWVLVDQGVSSASNAGLSILVAREVGAGSFGSFAVAFSVYAFLIGVSQALGGTPFAIRHQADPDPVGRRAAGAATGAAAAFGLVAGALVAAAGYGIGGATGVALAAVGLLLPPLFVQDCWRSILIARRRPLAATVNDSAWALVQFTGLGLLGAAGARSAWPYLFAWGSAALAGAAVGAVQLRTLPSLRAVPGWLATHRRLGGFYAAEWVTVVGAAQVSILLIGAIGSVTDVGALRGGQTLLGPLNVLSMSVTALAVPELARRRRGGHRLRVAVALSAGLAAVNLGWGAVLLALPRQAGVALLGATWPGTRGILAPMALWMAGVAVHVGPGVALRAEGRAAVSFRVGVVHGATVVCGGLLGMAAGGLTGATIGFAAASWLTAAVWWRALLRARTAGPAAEPSEPRRRNADIPSLRRSTISTSRLAAAISATSAPGRPISDGSAPP